MSFWEWYLGKIVFALQNKLILSFIFYVIVVLIVGYIYLLLGIFITILFGLTWLAYAVYLMEEENKRQSK